MSTKFIKRLAVGFVAAIAVVAGFSTAAQAATAQSAQDTTAVVIDSQNGNGWD